MTRIKLSDILLSQKVVSKTAKPIYLTTTSKTIYGFDTKWDITSCNLKMTNYGMYYDDGTVVFRKGGDELTFNEVDVKEVFKFDKPREIFKSKQGYQIFGSYHFAIILKTGMELFLTKKESSFELPSISY